MPGDSVVPLASALPALREFDVKASFYKYPFRREVQLGLLKLGVAVPTRVQDLIIPKLLEGISVFMLAQTGTGKTLAYLLPIVHKLLESNGDGFYPMSTKPRAVIIQPTRELAEQTIHVLRHFNIRSALLASGKSFQKEAQALYHGADIVVGTPHRLVLHLGKENCFLGQVQHVVVDEADTLCDTFYERDTQKLLKGMRHDSNQKPQIIIVGATRTGAVSAFLRKHLNDTAILPVVTMDAHMPPPQVEQVFVPTRGKRRLAVLWDIMAELPAVGRKTLIFSNRVPTCKFVNHSLREHGMSSVAMHGNMDPKKRKQVWKAFSGSEADVMVTTNLASRGLDFSNVHHVIMYDFPLNLADYLHRVGRTARGGKAGRVTTITPRRYWPFVTKIQEASKQGKPIEVRDATKNMKKILKMEAWRKAAESSTLNKYQKNMVKKRLGMPPAGNIGSKETKAAMKAIVRRVRAIKQVRFLWKRGILKRGEGLPRQPDMQVEASESQTVSTLVRARDGLLQVMPRRRRQPRESDTIDAAPSIPQPGERSENRGAVQRRRRPIM